MASKMRGATSASAKRRSRSKTPVPKQKRSARKKMGKEEEAVPLGRIITFYSYKGGTGRTMALANAAWILASNGRRVLMIDWDLEAPGLHQYIAPFLSDPDLSRSQGLIDFFVSFSEAARLQRHRALLSAADGGAPPWYEAHASLQRFITPLNHVFAAPANGSAAGSLDFVPAGRQGPSYGIRIEAFNWSEFYAKLGGGVFLEALKTWLRREYRLHPHR